MMRSLYSGVSGLKAHQLKLDVISDNVSNVNTIGFKRGQINFQDVLYQTLRGGFAASDTTGGTNAQQVGLGVRIGSLTSVQSQGMTQGTGFASDLMIQGDGFFVLQDPSNQDAYYYTRAGAFNFDDSGNLVHSATGFQVLSTDGTPMRIDDEKAKSFSFSRLGVLNYIDENDDIQEAGTIALAKFRNPAGLLKTGQNVYSYSDVAGAEAGGELRGGVPGEDGRGTVITGALEMSNVELAQEFTDMIMAQRGFQANARVITTSDELLQEIANLKR